MLNDIFLYWRSALVCCLEPPEVTVTVSLGVTVTLCSLDGNPEEVLQRADAALYEAKAKGRNRVEAVSKASGTVGSHAAEEKSRKPGKVTGAAR